MTKKQYRQKCRLLKRQVNKFIDDKIERALFSGAIDLKNYEDDFRLPKIVISAICAEASYQYNPLDKGDSKDAKNLQMFL